MCEVRQTMAKMCKNMFQIRNCRCHHRHPYCINSSRVLFAQVRAEQFRLYELLFAEVLFTNVSDLLQIHMNAAKLAGLFDFAWVRQHNNES